MNDVQAAHDVPETMDSEHGSFTILWSNSSSEVRKGVCSQIKNDPTETPAPGTMAKFNSVSFSKAAAPMVFRVRKNLSPSSIYGVVRVQDAPELQIMAVRLVSNIIKYRVKRSSRKRS